MPLAEAPLVSFSGGTVLVAYTLYQFGQFLGVGKTDYYASLEGLELRSLSSQAGEWALAGIVPTSLRVPDADATATYEVATFAGGCFWGTELHFQRMPGVLATCVGYTQGRMEKPSYGQVCSGTTGHTEGIQMLYDPAVVSYGDCFSSATSCSRRLTQRRSTQPSPSPPPQVSSATSCYRRSTQRHSTASVTTSVLSTGTGSTLTRMRSGRRRARRSNASSAARTRSRAPLECAGS